MRQKAGIVGVVALAAGLPMWGSPARAQSSNQPAAPAPPSSDFPQAAASPAGFHEHDGFFVRAALGAAALHANWKEGTYDWSVKGTGYAIAVAVGGSVTRHFVVYAELTQSVANAPTLTVGGDSTALPNYDVTLAGFGPGAAYYLVPENLYVSVTLAFSQLRTGYNGPTGSEGSGTDLHMVTDTDIGGTLMVGKEWWVSANWSLGLAGIVHLASMKTTLADSRVTAQALSLVLSATYN